MRPYDLIIFDCDGTLVDSELAYNQCAIDLFSEYGVPKYTLDYTYQYWMGKAFENIVAFEAEKNNIELNADAMREKFIADVPSYQQKYIKEIEGAIAGVKALQSSFKTCVASNGEMRNIVSSLKLGGFDALFETSRVFSKDQVARAKPFPDLFLYACENMNVAPNKAIVIEDSISGVKAGRAANMYTIGFNGVGHSELQSNEKLREVGADIVFSTWKDILDHINSL